MRTLDNQATPGNYNPIQAISDRDTAYRALASAAVAQAARDYVRCLVKPDYKTEEAQAKEMLDTLNTLKDLADMVREKRLQAQSFRKAVKIALEKFEGYLPAVYDKNRKTKTFVDLREAATAGGLDEIEECLARAAVTAHQKRDAFVQKTHSRFLQRQGIDRFLADGTLEFYSNGVISSEAFRKACEERAEEILAARGKGTEGEEDAGLPDYL